jgi:hypothetical protein
MLYGLVDSIVSTPRALTTPLSRARGSACRSGPSDVWAVIVSDAQFMIRSVRDGVGSAYILEDYVAEHIEAFGSNKKSPAGAGRVPITRIS